MNTSLFGINGKIKSGKDTVAKMLQFLTVAEEDGVFADYDSFPRDLVQNRSEWEIRKFADKIKDIVCLLIGCTREQLEDQEFKNKPLGEEWDKWEVSVAGKTFSVHSTKSKAKKTAEAQSRFHDTDVFIVNKITMTARKLMQIIGTEAGREVIHPDIWVNSLFADYTPRAYGAELYFENETHHVIEGTQVYRKWIISDLRFENELQRIESYNGVTIRIDRKTENRFPDLWDEYVSQDEFEEWEAFLQQHYPDTFDTLYHPSETALDDYEGWTYRIDNNGIKEDLFNQVQNIYQILTENNSGV